MIQLQFVVNAAIFSILGLVIFGIAFIIIDKLTPYDLWREITEKQNVAVAILVGAVALGISIIIAAAVH